jgi:hypothetical protein
MVWRASSERLPWQHQASACAARGRQIGLFAAWYGCVVRWESLRSAVWLPGLVEIARSEDAVGWDRPQCGESSLTVQVSNKSVLTAADSRKPEPHSCRFQQIGHHSARSQPTASSLRRRPANSTSLWTVSASAVLTAGNLRKRRPHRGESQQIFICKRGIRRRRLKQRPWAYPPP